MMTGLSIHVGRVWLIALVCYAGFGVSNGSGMGTTAVKLDPRSYFPDPRIARFVADVQDGDLGRVRSGLKEGVDPNSEGREGFRPLFFVFAASTADVARVLLASGA